MAELSPAAQAVLDAFIDCPIFEDEDRIAAALRALADQVVPVDSRLGLLLHLLQLIRGSRRQMNIRRKILAIAAELEG